LKLEELFGKVRVRIKGMTPLLMHRIVDEELERRGRTTRKVPTHKEYAEAHKYVTTIDGQEVLCIYNQHIYSMILEAAKGMKIGKSPAWRVFAGTIRIEPEHIPLKRNGEYIRGDDYEIDIRPVNVQNNKILRARAKITDWEAEFIILYDREMHDEKSLELLKMIIEQGGRRVGLMDYRPQHKGWFGTFLVEEFKIEG